KIHFGGPAPCPRTLIHIEACSKQPAIPYQRILFGTPLCHVCLWPGSPRDSRSGIAAAAALCNMDVWRSRENVGVPSLLNARPPGASSLAMSASRNPLCNLSRKLVQQRCWAESRSYRHDLERGGRKTQPDHEPLNNPSFAEHEGNDSMLDHVLLSHDSGTDSSTHVPYTRQSISKDIFAKSSSRGKAAPHSPQARSHVTCVPSLSKHTTYPC
ncbi:hypothetical protein BKA66DRAFT_585785, partial [Pyrenochaeta sp. MPI-SDFR-AT-0127]